MESGDHLRNTSTDVVIADIRDSHYVFWTRHSSFGNQGMKAETKQEIKRKELQDVRFPQRTLSSVRAEQITFPAGQQAPRHTHPCPVVGMITYGTCLLQVEGEPEQIIKAGNPFYEPADTPIAHFDNYSDSEPMTFVAFYLKDKEKELVQVLPDGS